MGDFNCKKFLLTTVVSYLPLPFLPIPLYQLIDTSWIAPGNWIIKQVLPSSEINLSAIGLSIFILPGNMKEIIPALVTKIKEEDLLISDFNLYQNYPNPFNPNTNISWQSPIGSWQTLKVYDVLGNEVATLVNEYKPAGNYEVEFDASRLTSGVYLYQMKTGSFIESRKMVLVK
jgi:hypothetical protein